MPIKNLTLGLALMFSVTLAQAGTYTVKPGDTLGGIASRFNVKVKDLVRENGLSNAHKLKLGQSLRIPNAPVAKNATPSARNLSGYAVRNGENDWSIAVRHGITASALRAANPQVNWRNLQIGTRLTIPGQRVATHSKIAAPKKVARGSGGYNVRAGDNDWTIARRLGTTPKALRQANPSVRWARIQPGQRLQTPGGVAIATVAKAKTGVIRGRHAMVARDGATVRRGPATSAGKISVVSAGGRVALLDRQNGWYKVRFTGGTTGWVRADLLRASAPPRVAQAIRRPAPVRVAAKRPAPAKATQTRVAQAGKTKAVQVAVMKRQLRAARLQAAKINRDRRLAEATRNRRAAWAARTAKRRAESTAVAYVPAASDSVVSRAQSWRGVRYRYGAMSRSATDCSGFTSQVYRSVGVRLPRTSREQSRIGASVPKGQLKPGDLVFFRTSRGTRISHVGIYQGSGRFIHASSGGGRVQTSNLSEGYYRNRFVTARRVNGKKIRVPAAKPVAKAPERETVEVISPDPQPVAMPPSDPASGGN